ncbi:MAG TPA: hypothetical protein VFG78_10370 [Gemmatimonadota bacterium]|nr:hypothetical protein [Gemmatimonadota bacterium]
MTDLKPISPEGIPHALEKVERYRLLNEPAEAESICRDVLRAEPGNQRALVMLLLTLTDQFGRGTGVNDARAVLERLDGEYERAYYGGIICERQGKAQLRTGTPGSKSNAHHWIQEAMAAYERAETLRTPGNDDAILRWNACARLLRDRELAPRPEDLLEHPIE